MIPSFQYISCGIVVVECCIANKNQAVTPRLLKDISGAEREGGGYTCDSSFSLSYMYSCLTLSP